MRKIYIYLSILAVILISIVVVYYYITIFSSKNVKDTLEPTPAFPTLVPPNEEPAVEPTLSQEQLDQLEADKEFGQWTKDLYETYPWYDNLPLQTEKYFVYFDINQKKFIADFYQQGETEILKKEILGKLQSFGINTDQYEFVWNQK